MMRPTILALIMLFLVSCVPSTSPVDLQTSQNYAEEISENHFRHTLTFKDKFTGTLTPEDNRFRKKKLTKAVVPVQAGTTFLFEEDDVIQGKLRVRYHASDRKGDAIIHNETARFEATRLYAPEGWTVRLTEIQKRFVFDSSAEAPPELSETTIIVDMGGQATITRQGVLTRRFAVEVSVPQQTQPGRYLVKTRYRHKDSVSFIVEVL